MDVLSVGVEAAATEEAQVIQLQGNRNLVAGILRTFAFFTQICFIIYGIKQDTLKVVV